MIEIDLKGILELLPSGWAAYFYEGEESRRGEIDNGWLTGPIENTPAIFIILYSPFGESMEVRPATVGTVKEAIDFMVKRENIVNNA